MANSYSQILIQFVFAGQNRERLISPSIREELQKYMTGIVSNRGHKPLAVYCMPDHCHLLVGLNPQQSISNLARVVKSGSSKWVNDQQLSYGKFAWQPGYGAFSYARSQLEYECTQFADRVERMQPKLEPPFLIWYYPPMNSTESAHAVQLLIIP